MNIITKTYKITIVFHQQIFLGEEKNKIAAHDAIGSRTSLAVSRGITRCVGSFYYAENKLQILVLFTSLIINIINIFIECNETSVFSRL